MQHSQATEKRKLERQKSLVAPKEPKPKKDKKGQ